MALKPWQCMLPISEQQPFQPPPESFFCVGANTKASKLKYGINFSSFLFWTFPFLQQHKAGCGNHLIDCICNMWIYNRCQKKTRNKTHLKISYEIVSGGWTVEMARSWKAWASCMKPCKIQGWNELNFDYEYWKSSAQKGATLNMLGFYRQFRK